MKLVALVILMTMPDGSEYEAGIPMKSADSCGAAMIAIADAITADWPDTAVLCRPTEIMFASPRPVRRPSAEALEESNG